MRPAAGLLVGNWHQLLTVMHDRRWAERYGQDVCTRHLIHDASVSAAVRYTEAKRREVEEAARKVKKAAKRAAKQAADAAEADAAEAGKSAPASPPAAAAGSAAAAKSAAAPQTPICFLFPGQGSQALSMLNVRCTLHSSSTLTAQPGVCRKFICACTSAARHRGAD